MLDIHFIRENKKLVQRAIEVKGDRANLDELLKLDALRRKKIREADNLKADRNRVSEEIGRLKKAGKDGNSVIAEMKKVSEKIKVLDEEIRHVEKKMRDILIYIPNIPHPSVPEGPDSSYNQFIKEWGTLSKFDFQIETHWEIGPRLGVLDFDRGSRLSGSNFVSYKGVGA